MDKINIHNTSCVLTCESLVLNPLNAELNPICHLLALVGVHFLHVSRIRVNCICGKVSDRREEER